MVCGGVGWSGMGVWGMGRGYGGFVRGGVRVWGFGGMEIGGGCGRIGI